MKKEPKKGGDQSNSRPDGPYVVRITDDAREDEMEENMQAVGSVLGNLKAMAQDMNEEIDKQNKQIDRITTKVHEEAISLSQFRCWSSVATYAVLCESRFVSLASSPFPEPNRGHEDRRRQQEDRKAVEMREGGGLAQHVSHMLFFSPFFYDYCRANIYKKNILATESRKKQRSSHDLLILFLFFSPPTLGSFSCCVMSIKLL